MLGVSRAYAGSALPWERAHHPRSVLSPAGGVPTLAGALQHIYGTAPSSVCGTSKRRQHRVATSAFLLPSPSYKEAGGEKLFSLILFFLQIRGRPDKASAQGGWGA